MAQEGDTHTFIVRIFLDPLRVDTRWVKLEPVFVDRKRTDFLEDRFEATRLAVTNGEEIGVPCRAVCFLGPEFKKQRPLQNKNLPVFRLPDPEEKAFQSILRQKQPKIFFPLACTIRQALPNGGRKIGEVSCQDRDSIY